jgi:hypothetical protein
LISHVHLIEPQRKHKKCKMPSSKLPVHFANLLMNSYDSKHLHVLNLIESCRWAEITSDDMHELQVLIACKYVALKQCADKAPSITLNSEGRHYHHSLSQRAKRISPAG